MGKNVCIICGNERNGLEVNEDAQIKLMRWIKKNIFRSQPKNYNLVVCKDCFITYKKKKDKYDRNKMLYVTIGVIFLLMLAIFSNGRYLGAIFYGGLVIIGMYLLSQLSYIPSVNIPIIKAKESKKRTAK